MDPVCYVCGERIETPEPDPMIVITRIAEPIDHLCLTDQQKISDIIDELKATYE